MRNKLSLLAIPAVALILLSGCASEPEPAGPEPAPAPQKIVTEPGFTSAPVKPQQYQAVSAEVPHILEVAQGGFTVITGGSSSCVDAIESITYDNEKNIVSVFHTVPPADRMCTTDFVLRGEQVIFDEPVLRNLETVSFFVDGNAASVNEAVTE